ncbi:MAG: hypothetical protein R3C59_27300 [Planctomycetaceae bacterium]
MRSTLKTVCVAMLAVCQWQMIGSEANAQGFNRIDKPFDRPTFSPYLNLFRNGNGPVMNYFGTVRPQLDFYAQDQRLEQGLENIQGRQNQPNGFDNGPRRIPGVYTMGVTGHATGFNTIRPAGAGGQNSTGQQFAGSGNQFRNDQFGSNQQGGNQLNSGGNDQFGGGQFGGGQFGGSGGSYGNPYGGYSGHSFGFGSGF